MSGHEFDFHGLLFTCSMVPFVPAKVSGPVESCYPAEGGYAEDARITGVDDDEGFAEWLEGADLPRKPSLAEFFDDIEDAYGPEMCAAAVEDYEPDEPEYEKGDA